LDIQPALLHSASKDWKAKII